MALDGGVTADAGAAATADLGNAQVKHLGAHALALAGGDDHAGVGHCQTDNGDDAAEDLVGQHVGELVEGDVLGRADARHADGVRADAELGLQVLGMHEQADEVIAVGCQAIKHADAHVVAAAQLGTIHGLGVIAVVALRARGMQCLVVLAVVGFLEEDVGTDTGGLELLVSLDLSRGDVHVQAADLTIAHLGIIDGVNRLQNVLQRVHHGVLAGLESDALVAHLDQSLDLSADLILRQFLARDGLVLGMVGAIDAPVDAIVRQIKRGEHHNAVAVEAALHVLGQLLVALNQVGLVTVQQDRRLAVGQALAQGGFIDNLFYQSTVALILLSVG